MPKLLEKAMCMKQDFWNHTTWEKQNIWGYSVRLFSRNVYFWFNNLNSVTVLWLTQLQYDSNCISPEFASLQNSIFVFSFIFLSCSLLLISPSSLFSSSLIWLSGKPVLKLITKRLSNSTPICVCVCVCTQNYSAFHATM